jgi:alpha-1,4-digalacturonate transport system permease protein
MSRIQRLIGVRRFGYVFVLPNLVIFGLFIIVPMLLNFYFAFTGGTSILPENRTVVGTENLQTLLTCEDYSNPLTCDQDLFWRAAGNTARFVAFEVVAIVLLSMITALALNRNIRARGFFRSVFFYPVLLSPVVVALIWKWILQQNGLLNGVIESLGGESVPFLVNASWAQFWAIVISVWAQMGFYTLILLAGLQAIPSDLYEAASIDGAGVLARLMRITMPLWAPTLLVVTVLTVIRAVQVFDVVFVLTGGGPGTATLYLVQFIYQTAFDDRNYGLAAAASLLLALVLLVFTIVQLRARRATGEVL